eukprot:CAMPEP_0197185166 /NCGR_PEP_ID=MMETSP1423-20130617/11334_1 /TAXON_ID=476441 /ORGANISM="Pseudo-nitzschia heimii, Strain UNC1101" /LENGTH=177 /DNA_ID=CAMNT_0042636151 /DNA_START=109 /DNA_END=642 /DNA_ORIENTATION=-
MAESSGKTVRFNVGGTIYEVSRSLLDRYPDTMLARLASDTWKTNGDDENAALFIERDGDRFRYCLDYMRDCGIVNLPLTVSRAAVLLDLEYYGFEAPDSSRISVEESLPLFKADFDRIIGLLRKSRRDEIELLENQDDQTETLAYIEEVVSPGQRNSLTWSEAKVQLKSRRRRKGLI